MSLPSSLPALSPVVFIRSCVSIVWHAASHRPDRYHCILFSCLFSIISHVALIIWHFEWLRPTHARTHTYRAVCRTDAISMYNGRHVRTLSSEKSISSLCVCFSSSLSLFCQCIRAFAKKATHKNDPEIYTWHGIVPELHNTMWMGYTQCVRFPKSIFIDGIPSAAFEMTSTIDLILFETLCGRIDGCDWHWSIWYKCMALATMVMPRDYVVVR